MGDMPLRSQVGAILAAEFGSRVQVEKTCLDDNGILVTGNSGGSNRCAAPLAGDRHLAAAIAGKSLVAARVAYYKRSRQDWFRLYLLPAALRNCNRRSRR